MSFHFVALMRLASDTKVTSISVDSLHSQPFLTIKVSVRYYFASSRASNQCWGQIMMRDGCVVWFYGVVAAEDWGAERGIILNTKLNITYCCGLDRCATLNLVLYSSLT